MRPEPPLAYQLSALPPRPEEVTGEAVLDRFLLYVKERGLELYPAQEEAILEIVSGKNVILSTPTGSGKSLVATAMIFLTMAERRRSVYTCPIKALVAEKFFDLVDAFGPENVGMMTGDATVNRDAPILVCTAEILSSWALREGADADVDTVVMDEFHYYADRERGVAWQVPLLTLPHARFLLMSATLGPTERFETVLTELTRAPTASVTGAQRPVPLDCEYRETPLHETLADLIRTGRAPVYLVNFTQRGAAEEAQNLLSVDFCTKEEKKAIAERLVGVKWGSPYGKEIQKLVRHGVGIHHAGLLPRYRRVVERLAQAGLLKVVSGTDTLGVGVNIPIRSVLFTKLCKFDGEKTAILSVRDFQQIAGRAGRKGFDDRGTVVVQAPEHVIENLRMESKAARDPTKKKKLVRKKPPDKGYVHWDRATFDRLVSSPPEPLVSRFSVSHGMLLSVLSRESNGCRAMARLIQRSHGRRAERRIVARTAVELYRSLVEAKIVTVEDGRVRIGADLQSDFSMNQALSLYLVHALELLERDSGTYCLDVLTLVESILENPDIVLFRQVDKLKGDKLAELKAQGVEYDERMAELEKIEYPKPNRDFIYDSFNAFAKMHPWIGTENIRPKSVAREMFEMFLSFPEYVKEYGLERGEGVLLRYLSEVYKTLVQSVPEPAKTPDVVDIVSYFGAIVRSTDSTLIDEWERLRGAGDPSSGEVASERPEAPDVTGNPKEFMVLVRNAVFAIVRSLSRRDYAGAASLVEPGEWTAERIEGAAKSFYEQHTALRLDPEARAPKNTRLLSTDDGIWRVQQILLDPEDDNDWMIELRIDLAKSREAEKPVLELVEITS